jgi:hypothetical protein
MSTKMGKDIDKEKEDLKIQVEALVEALDDMIPVVGKLMDLPFVNEIEKRIIENVVDYVWDAELVGLLNDDPCPWSA